MGDLLYLATFIAFVIVPAWAVGSAIEAAIERRKTNKPNQH